MKVGPVSSCILEGYGVDHGYWSLPVMQSNALQYAGLPNEKLWLLGRTVRPIHYIALAVRVWQLSQGMFSG